MTTHRKQLIDLQAERCPERALLVGVKDPHEREEHFEAVLAELGRLADTAGLVISGTVTQRLHETNRATLIGKGKVEEIQNLIQQIPLMDPEGRGVDVIIIGRDLSPGHQRNLERILKRRVLDRTELILDIFAQHAVTRDGKIQVELAQLRYLKPRLVGRGVELSRLGGGIGTRGPGETKLEVDRRKIDQRIYQLRKELEKCKRVGQIQRERRLDRSVISAAMVGYTNAGKSTLLNRLTKSTVDAKDQLFCTLDTTTRRLFLAEGPRLLLSDTVGFIENLPEPLLAAFRATLAVVEEADVLIHVLDASSDEAERHIEAVTTVLKELGADKKPMLTVLNKRDKVENELTLKILQRACDPALPFSATHDSDTTPLLEALKELAARGWE